DGCNDCVCNGGEWACTEKDCSSPSDSSTIAGISMLDLSTRQIILVFLGVVLFIGLILLRSRKSV
ncbi:MAG: hypothetical protein CMB31_07140, partial [Euryarchaeota archaeon]|nr:hypothetical protein [Euryarchaeota archaeon]